MHTGQEKLASKSRGVFAALSGLWSSPDISISSVIKDRVELGLEGVPGQSKGLPSLQMSY